MGVDWLFIKQSLESIDENVLYLQEHAGENKDEDNLRKSLINIDIENLRNELFK